MMNVFILNKTLLSMVLLNNTYIKHPRPILFHDEFSRVCLESYLRLGISLLRFKDVWMVSVLKEPKQFALHPMDALKSIYMTS